MDLKQSDLDEFIISSIGEKFNHDTLMVTSLSEFVDVVTKIAKMKENGLKHIITFRGHASTHWNLTPIIKRLGLEKHEKEIIDLFKVEKTEEYNSSMSSLDIVAKMQHYGYPTRLVDFTENPLVALYFACQPNERHDGRVIVNEGYLDLHFDIPFVNALFELIDKYSYALYEKNIEEFDEFVKGLVNLPQLKEDQGIHKFLDIIYNFGRSGIVTIPYRISDRQKAQKSSFLIFPDNIVNPADGNPIDLSEAMMQPGWDIKLAKNVFDNTILTPSNLESKFNSIIIPNEYKKDILHDLSLLGIDKSFLFPELEYSAEVFIQKLKKEYK